MTPTAKKRQSNPASDKQLAYISDLESKVGEGAARNALRATVRREFLPSDLSTFPSHEASRYIDALLDALAHPTLPLETETLPALSAGSNTTTLSAPTTPPVEKPIPEVVVENNGEAGFRVVSVPAGVRVKIINKSGGEVVGEATITGPHPETS